MILLDSQSSEHPVLPFTGFPIKSGMTLPHYLVFHYSLFTDCVFHCPLFTGQGSMATFSAFFRITPSAALAGWVSLHAMRTFSMRMSEAVSI